MILLAIVVDFSYDRYGGTEMGYNILWQGKPSLNTWCVNNYGT